MERDKLETNQPVIPTILVENIDLFACPICGGSLRVSTGGESIGCAECDANYDIDSGIPLLFCTNDWTSKKDVTATVQSFYDEHPFPNYDDVDSDQSLRQKAEKGIFARLLNDQIPHGSKVLEVGCGTGALSNYLGLKWGRTVFGSDLSVNALKLGQEFRLNNNIDNVQFLNMNLFRPAFKQQVFDVVVCNGVLHHTSDPFLGFQSISSLVKDGGYIIIGLYNRYGRIPTDIRRLIFRVLGRRFMFLDSRLRDKSLSKLRKETWFQDQYKHPHESKHTIGQVLKWFDQTGFEFVNCFPKATPFDDFAADEQLFKTNPKGGWLDHLLVQAGMLIGGGKEGGFYIMIGRKNAGVQNTQCRNGQ